MDPRQHPREEFGLNDPVHIQYLNWIKDLLHGDLGKSVVTRGSVLERISGRLQATLELTVVAFALTVVIAIPVGVFVAAKQYSIADNVMTFLAIFWISMPQFWLGLIFMLVFSANLGWLPISGRGGPLWTVQGLKYLILPALSLGLPGIALIMRLTRSGMLEVLNEDYIRTARSKGLRERVVVLKHALRNALLSIVTMLGMRIPWLLGGAVIVETVFAWPGMGRLLVNAVFQRDYPVVQGVTLMIAGLVMLSNLTVDLLYAYIDPQIKYD